MLRIPQYIKNANVLDRPFGYPWDDENPHLYHLDDESLASRIARICDRGVIALSAGSAEWIAWRLSAKLNETVLFDEIEAVWAGLIDWRYLRPLLRAESVPDREKWKGQVRGPASAAFYLLARIVGVIKKSEPASPEASGMCRLASHVMSEKKSFNDWRRLAIQRLAKFYPSVEEAELGSPVPREALDPEYNYHPSMANQLLSQFLRTLDAKKNPFLASPDEMIKQGFKGTPYAL